jgi:clan AA aspartic protease
MIIIEYADYEDRRPAPVVTVKLSDADGENATVFERCLVDSGADRTVLPNSVAKQLGIREIDCLEFAAFDGRITELSIGIVNIQFGSLSPVPISVAFNDSVEEILIGREVLNQYRILLDGPNRKLEVE